MRDSRVDVSQVSHNAFVGFISVLGTCYKKCNPTDAIAVYRQAVSLYTDNARITQAAKLSKEIGELFENEQIDEDGKSHIVLAIESYEQAAELFGMEDSKYLTAFTTLSIFLFLAIVPW